MKKTYINPETEVTRIAPIVMAADSVSFTMDSSKTKTADYGADFESKDDNYGGPNLWD